MDAVVRRTYVLISPPATRGLLNGAGMIGSTSDSTFRSTFSVGRITTETFAPADARMRTWTSCTTSRLSEGGRSRSIRTTSAAVRPTRRPSRTVRPWTPGPAVQAGGLGALAGAVGATGAVAGTNRHSMGGGRPTPGAFGAGDGAGL